MTGGLDSDAWCEGNYRNNSLIAFFLRLPGGLALYSSQDTRQVVTWGQGLNLPADSTERLLSGKISEPEDLVALLHRSLHLFTQYFCESYEISQCLSCLNTT